MKVDREKLTNQILECGACSAREECMNPVPFEGSSDADLMLIGRNPGVAEDKIGRPFVGNAGDVLNSGLNSAGIKRSNVFITNLCKCKTKNNRNMKWKEVKICFNRFLRKEFKLVNPKVVVVFGAQPNYFLNGITGVSKNNGRIFKHKEGFIVVVSIHPAAVCFNSKKNLKPFLNSVHTAREVLDGDKKP